MYGGLYYPSSYYGGILIRTVPTIPPSDAIVLEEETYQTVYLGDETTSTITFTEQLASDIVLTKD